jgi:hypothetical protein
MVPGKFLTECLLSNPSSSLASFNITLARVLLSEVYKIAALLSRRRVSERQPICIKLSEKLSEAEN